MPRRYEREIMELLERKEREHRGRERIQRVRHNVDQARGRVAPASAWQKLGGIRWTVASIVLALIAFVLHQAVPSVFTNVGIIVAVGLFLVPVFVRPARSVQADEPMWRGQRIEPTPFPIRPMSPMQRGLFARLRRFLEDVRRGRHR